MNLRIGMVGVIAIVSGMLGCSDDKSSVGPDLVTISGVVRDVDSGAPAAGVRVTLYGTSYVDVRPTGSDGRYSVQVPPGSKLVLYTDDFDLGTDAWFPLINCDVPTISVDQLSETERGSWPIHACPQTHVPQFGSVAWWDDYLTNADDQSNSDIYAAESCANSGGIVSVVFATCQAGTWPFLDSMTVATNSPNFPMGYMRREWWLDMTPPGPDCVYPPGHAGTDSCGIATSIGDSTATESTVMLTFSDLRSSRGFAPGPYEIPVRKGTISLVFALGVDGVPNKHFRETAMCLGMIPPTGAPRFPFRQLAY